MIGYHYTSQENWLKIMEQGLRPYVLRKDIVHDGVPGIWLWEERQRGRSHSGCIMFQIRTKQTLCVVELAVTVPDLWTRRPGWENTQVVHEGSLTGDNGTLLFFYHRDARARIAWKPIPAKQIQIIGTYHFDDAWTQTDDACTVQLLERSSVERTTR